ncbi:MAG: hypothetical protein F4048_11060 [Gammaproteobacteria bacterium]|nr:hypothetical protein [Gammaproteobacteria bacterium]
MASLVEVNGRKIQKEWFEEGRAEGRTEGRTEGIAQGIQRGRSEERERLRREMSVLKLDPDTAAKVSKLLDHGG